MGKASRRKTANRSKSLLDSSRTRQKALGIDASLMVRNDLPQAQKISNAICEILESEREPGWSLEEHRFRTEFIVLAWNLSLLSMTEEQEALALKDLADHAAKTHPIAGPKVVAEVSRLMAKKRAMFPDDKRYIVAHELKLVGNKLHVTAQAISKPSQDSVTS